MKVFTIIAIFLICSNVYAKQDILKSYLKSNWDINKTQKIYLEKGEILVESDVTTTAKIQHFKFRAYALSNKTCRKALRKLSMLENFKNLIGFITRSTYQEESKLFTLRADHALLPSAMLINIIVDRPTKTGKYQFTFPTGMFTGLKGYFEITSVNKKCLFYAKSAWSGKKSKHPDFLIELFSEGLSKIAGGILMRKI